jgi:hypothetical protein
MKQIGIKSSTGTCFYVLSFIRVIRGSVLANPLSGESFSWV